MTQRADPPGGKRTTSDLVSALGRGVVHVQAGAGGGSGAVVLANGLVSTSHHAVGFEVDVVVIGEDGRRVDARVVWVDVERDAAFVLPHGASFPAIPPAIAKASSVGDELLVVERTAAGRIAAQPTVVAADAAIGRVPVIAIAAPNGAHGTGAVALDHQGRVVGCVAFQQPHHGQRTVVVPIRALSRELAAFDVAATDLGDKVPVYRCNACAEPFTADSDRCLRCGELLPHASRATGALADAERLVKEMLSTLGIAANRARVAPRAWRFDHRPDASGVGGRIEVRLDDDGEHVSLRAPVVRIPAAHHDALYRLLLTMNDGTSERFRFGISGDAIVISFTEPTALFADCELGPLAAELVTAAAHFRRLFLTYDVEPLSEL